LAAGFACAVLVAPWGMRANNATKPITMTALTSAARQVSLDKRWSPAFRAAYAGWPGKIG